MKKHLTIIYALLISSIVLQLLNVLLKVTPAWPNDPGVFAVVVKVNPADSVPNIEIWNAGNPVGALRTDWKTGIDSTIKTYLDEHDF